MPKFKLLIFTSYLGGGGAEKHIVRLTNQLIFAGYEIVIVTPNKKGQYEEELNPSIKLVKIGSAFPYHFSSTLARITCIIPLAKLIQKEQPSLIFSVLDIHNVIMLTALKLVKIQIPIVLGVQNTVSEAYKDKWNPVNQYIMYMIKHHYHVADKIIVLSNGVAKDLLNVQPALKQKIEVIYNIGVDANSYDLGIQTLDETLPDSKLIVACGRLTYQKGYPYLIEAIAKLNQHMQACLWILGEGEERKKLEKLINKYKLTNHVKFIGFKPSPLRYMAAADLFVLSSLYEGFGNVIVEAMSCGTPVVATDCPHGPNEIITDHGNGLLVPIKNPEKLAEAMLKVLQSPSLQKKLSINGKKRAYDFEASSIARKYNQAFQSVLQQSVN